MPPGRVTRGRVMEEEEARGRKLHIGPRDAPTAPWTFHILRGGGEEGGRASLALRVASPNGILDRD